MRISIQIALQSKFLFSLIPKGRGHYKLKQSLASGRKRQKSWLLRWTVVCVQKNHCMGF